MLIFFSSTVSSIILISGLQTYCLSLLKQFPDKYSPREIQEEILNKIDEKISSGYKKIILSAPTGVGKSLVGATIVRNFDRSFVVTASKHLQDQYSKDLSFLMPVKGKQNFPCLKLMETENVRNLRRAKRWGLTCEKGKCKEKTTKNGKEITEICKFKPSIKDVETGNYDTDPCHYYLQKYKALVSKHSLWNYYSFFQIMKFNKKIFSEYLDRNVSIFDEAHKIEDQIIQFIGIDIYKKQLEECGIDISHYDFSDIDSMIQLTDNMAEFYARRQKELEQSRAFQENPDYDLISRLERRYEKVSQARIDMVSDKENFVVNDPEKDLDGNFRMVSIKPIDISKFVKSFFETEYQVFMSATIDKESFCENTGMVPSEVAFVDTPKSPFPIENRKINFLNVKQLSYNSSKEDELEVIKKIDELLSKHSNERGLILTSSVPRCYMIRKNLSAQNRKRIRVCHSINANKKTQDQILKEHVDDKSGVLLSSSLWEGVDLKDDLSRFQIIAKIPYPPYTEKRVKAKMAKFPLWYNSQTLKRMLQGFGRSIRSEKDWAVTYVLDSAVNRVLSGSKSMIPKAYHDVLGFS